MVETRQAEDMSDGYMYPDDNLDPYLQDADILDRPDLFYGPGKLVFWACVVVICSDSKVLCPFFFCPFLSFVGGGGLSFLCLIWLTVGWAQREGCEVCKPRYMLAEGSDRGFSSTIILDRVQTTAGKMSCFILAVTM